MVAGAERVTVRSVLFDLAVAGGVAMLTVPYVYRPHVLFGAAMAVAVGFRRFRPLAVMLVLSALALGHLVILGRPDPTSFDIAVLIAMYSVVKYAPVLWHGFVAAGIVAVGLVIEQVRHLTSRWWYSALLLFGFCTAVWLVAYTLRTRRRYLRSLEERAATAERERDHLAQLALAGERAGIARELHDVVAHTLAVMVVQAEGARYALADDPAQVEEALRTIAATGRDAVGDMHRIVGVLRGDGPAVDPDRGVATIGQVLVLVERARSTGLAVTYESVGDPPDMSAAEELTVFRVVQEALTNAIRHAGAEAKVAIRLEYSPRLVRISVIDDGGGRLASSTGAAGHGLIGMRERIAVHDGQFSSGPRFGGGWQVDATLPVQEVT
ncbi:sensor histidine kinase [Dactylosporangium sp. NPDC049140]|uniref:sensor histidine kinase n=1 Tax=Dactylosporangium sp. NPDC049140 TaxID=3155647 RepID=UPI0033D2544C